MLKTFPRRARHSLKRLLLKFQGLSRPLGKAGRVRRCGITVRGIRTSRPSRFPPPGLPASLRTYCPRISPHRGVVSLRNQEKSFRKSVILSQAAILYKLCQFREFEKCKRFAQQTRHCEALPAIFISEDTAELFPSIRH